MSGTGKRRKPVKECQWVGRLLLYTTGAQPLGGTSKLGVSLPIPILANWGLLLGVNSLAVLICPMSTWLETQYVCLLELCTGHL